MINICSELVGCQSDASVSKRHSISQELRVEAVLFDFITVSNRERHSHV